MSGTDWVYMSFRMTLFSYKSRSRLGCLMSASLSISRKVIGFSLGSWVTAETAANLPSVGFSPAFMQIK